MAQFSCYPRIPGAVLGQKTMAQSAPVVIASDQSAVPIIAAQLPPALGAQVIASSMSVNIASNQTVPVSGTFFQATQPVSAVSLPLPSGASTSAKQPALGSAGTASADVITVQGIASMTALKVDGSAVTQPISGTVTVNPLTNSSTVKAQLQDNAGAAITLGSKVSASSIPVVISSDQAAVPASQSGTWSVRAQDGSGNSLTSSTQGSNRGLHEISLGYSSSNAPVRNDYSSTSVSTSAYTQLVASTTSDSQEIEIFDSSGQVLALATGAAASEVNQIYIVPGGNGRVKLRIASGTRVSIKAITASANSGQIIINFYG